MTIHICSRVLDLAKSNPERIVRESETPEDASNAL